jgi:hypothetical protein
VTEQPDKNTLEWVAEQEKKMAIGEEIVKRASDEALDYIGDAIQNMTDVQWRKMSMETQIVEMGVGVTLADNLVPKIYKDMEKKLHKKLNLPKNVATAVRHIYMGRVIKNIRKELNDELDNEKPQAGA